MIPLLLGITALSRKGFNTYGAICFLEPNNPPHCVSSVTDMTVIDDDVKSGDNDENDILWSGRTLLYHADAVLKETFIH